LDDGRKPFSDRFGLPAQRLVWDAAPVGFRHAVVNIPLGEHLLSRDEVLGAVRLGLGTPTPAPSTDSWQPSSQMREAYELIESCEWWKVFQVAETIHARVGRNSLPGAGPILAKQYEAAINQFCLMHDIGWRMALGQFERRGAILEDKLLRDAEEQLRATGRQTSANELQKAISDLSKMPSPDITGAVQHTGAAIECLARELCGDPTLTLGEIIKKHDRLFPGAYRKLAEGIWGIASNQGRHLTEGGEPNIDQAMLLVGVVAPLCSFLLRQQKDQSQA
jgi:hypothetical protein